MAEKSPAIAAINSFEAAMAAGKELLFDDKQMISRIVAAERCFRRALELAPQSTDAMAHLAWALESQGRMTESKDWYDRVLAIQPTAELAPQRYPIALRSLATHLGLE